ncbi:MAG: hypothetical protein ABIR62_14415 [Dokdonella sp.]|uniref:tetratricopeptide repeat protein n=1 Tax=Dokdonella sp. TaxID=2291710 RepID=UPI0032649B7C
MAAFAAIAALAYLPGLHGGFVYDDWGSITGNTDVQVKTGALAEWWKAAIAFPSGTPPFRSLTMLTFAVNSFFGGLSPFGFKLTNLGIHLANGWLLFLALRSVFALRRETTTEAVTFDIGMAAAVIAGFWLLLPINLTAVLYVVQRLESLATSFTFLGLWWYATARRKIWLGEGGEASLWASVIVCTILGVLAKESGIMLPLYVVLLEICLAMGRNRDGRLSRATVGLFTATLLLPFLIGVYWMWGRYIGVALGTGHSAFLIDRLMTESRVIVSYIAWIVAPNLDVLTLYHDDITVSHGLLDPPSTLSSIVALTALFCAAIWQCRRRPLFALGIFWFFAGHLLTGTVVPLILAFEHRNYFPSAALLLASVGGLALEGPLRRTPFRIAAVVLVTFFYTGVLWMRADEWSSPLRLSSTEAAKRPLSPNAQYDYSQALLQESMQTQSSGPAQTALAVLQNARHLPNAGIHFEQSILTLLGESGYAGPEDIWTSLIAKLERAPPDTNGIHALVHLNHCFIGGQCKPSDVPELGKVYAAAFSHPPANGLLSVHGEYAWHILGDHALAESDYREVVRSSPNDLAAKSNLIVVLINNGKLAEARSLIEALERRNLLGMLDGFILPLRSTLDIHQARLPTTTPP